MNLQNITKEDVKMIVEWQNEENEAKENERGGGEKKGRRKRKEKTGWLHINKKMRIKADT